MENDGTGGIQMEIGSWPSGIPVVLLYDLDPKWSARVQEEVIDLASLVGQALDKTGHPTTPVRVTNSDLDSALSGYDPQEYLVFNWCESLPGLHNSECNVVQFLEQYGYTFTGATSATLELTSDKCRVKRLLDEAGIPTPGWEVYDKGASVKWKRFPAIVKPSREHCSEGIHRNAVVTTEVSLKNRIRYIIKRFQHPALAEDFIEGRELHVSLWGNDYLEMLPPVEMEFSSLKDKRDWVCTYESKFVPESEQYKNIKTLLPAPLSKDELSCVEKVCKAAYVLTGCRDYARIDVRMKDGLFYILDVNANADICPDTSTISAAEFAGYTYKEFLGRLVSFAARRHLNRGSEFALPSKQYLEVSI